MQETLIGVGLSIVVLHGKLSAVKGILYFTPRNITSDARELVSFDLNTEVFASTSLPKVDDGEYFSPRALVLVDCGCSLGLVSVSLTRSNGIIWVLEGSGADINPMHWTKRYTFSARRCPSERRLHDFLYIKKNGKMLLQCNRQVTSYDLETHAEETLVKNGRGLQMSMVCGCVESLLLFNG